VAELGDWTVGTGPLFRRLARAVAAAVDRGALAPGARLPSERALAAATWSSRGTAVAAYDLLVGDGVIERRRGSGTFVAEADRGEDHRTLPADREGSALVARLAGSGTGPAPGTTRVIDLSIAVLHDPTGLPLTSVATTDLVDPTDGDSPWGIPVLREAVARRLTHDGLPTSAAEVVITTGAQQAISIAAACWVRPGDTVVVDDPTYPGALAAFRAAGAEVVGVPVDAHGVELGALADALTSRPALVYVQSAGHNPTGSVLDEHRRQRVAELVTKTRVPLVEDVALAGLACGPGGVRPAPPIAARVGDHPTVVAGSLSKVFWSGLRVGFARAPAPVAARLARVKTTQDLGSSSVSQLLAARLLAHPDTPAFLADRDAALMRRRQVLADQLRTHLPTWDWDVPAGGLSLWVRLPAPCAEHVAHLALRHGVAVATAEGLSPGGGHPDRLRLSFAQPEPLLVEGVARLAAAWAAGGGRTLDG
jgi:DNA-binding transcriptional MocR family regulator